MPIITLTTDFGGRDGYVGAMKGVIESACAAKIVDIAHDLPRGDIAHAAWVVRAACPRFPEGTVHVVVVDPGVGGARRAVMVRTPRMYYVGPDNGVFAYVNALWARELEIDDTASATFHGRDVFAPAAAAIAAGGDPGKRVVRLTGELPWGERPAGEGRVIHVDHFGNLISDLPRAEAGEAVAIGGRNLPLVRTYEDVPPGELLAYIGSENTVEIAVRDGRADRTLDVPRGTPVVPVAAGGLYR